MRSPPPVIYLLQLNLTLTGHISYLLYRIIMDLQSWKYPLCEIITPIRAARRKRAIPTPIPIRILKAAPVK